MEMKNLDLMFQVDLMNRTLKMVHDALDAPKPKRPRECEHPENIEEGKDFWEYQSGRKIGEFLFKNTYRCNGCGEYRTVTEEAPNAP
jgi:hypothetical protein